MLRFILGSALCLALQPMSPLAQSAPRTIAEARADVNRDGKPETISVMMDSGGPVKGEKLCDCDDVLEGTFSVTVTFPDGRRVATPLTPFFGKETLSLCGRPWSLTLADYDGDGVSDFNLGQFDDCNAWRYRLFSFDAEGRATELSVPGGTLRVCDRANSTANIFLKGNVLQYTTRTGGEEGHYETLNLKWDKTRKFFIVAAWVAKVPVVPPNRSVPKG